MAAGGMAEMSGGARPPISLFMRLITAKVPRLSARFLPKGAIAYGVECPMFGTNRSPRWLLRQLLPGRRECRADNAYRPNWTALSGLTASLCPGCGERYDADGATRPSSEMPTDTNFGRSLR